MANRDSSVMVFSTALICCRVFLLRTGFAAVLFVVVCFVNGTEWCLSDWVVFKQKRANCVSSAKTSRNKWDSD